MNRDYLFLFEILLFAKTKNLRNEIEYLRGCLERAEAEIKILKSRIDLYEKDIEKS